MPITLTKKHVALAKKIAHKIWGKYSDEFGYKSDKRLKNSMVDDTKLENIHFFVGQFEIHDQQRFYRKAKAWKTTGLELAQWMQENYFKEFDSM